MFVNKLRDYIYVKTYLNECQQELATLKENSGEENSKLALKLQRTIRTYEKKLATMNDPITKFDQSNQTELVVDEPKPPQFEELEKDLVYYRQTNKDLKSKLRELVAKNQKLVANLKNDIPRAAHA